MSSWCWVPCDILGIDCYKGMAVGKSRCGCLSQMAGGLFEDLFGTAPAVSTYVLTLMMHLFYRTFFSSSSLKLRDMGEPCLTLFAC